MADWFSQNTPTTTPDAAASVQKSSGGKDWFAENESVPPDSDALYSSPSKPTVVDRFVSGVTGNLGSPNNPEDPIHQVVHGTANSLGRTTQAWHDMFTGHANPMTAAEMVPIVGPAAVDAGRMLGTPGQRAEGAGAAFGVAAPFAMHETAPAPESGLNLAEGDIPTPSTTSRIASGVRVAAPNVGKGLAKVAGGAALDYAIPGEARIGALIGTAPLVRSGMRDIGRGITRGIDDFRGPQFGPESAPSVSPGAPSAAVSPVAPSPVSVLPSGVARIGTTPAEAIQGLSRSTEGTVGTRAEMMRQLRLADQNGTTDAGKAAIIRRFEAPEYTPRQGPLTPEEAVIPQSAIAPPPVQSQSAAAGVPDYSSITQQYQPSRTRARFDENGKRIFGR